jgi:cellobiose phosphorylase
MGVVPSGTAENGEYHHGQVMMHVYRMMIEGEEETAWRQFKPVVSALRDENLCGPFDMPCTSYVSDRDDPHYGKGMYFGLSGSTDWIIALLEQVAGIRLNLHDKTLPDLVVEPRVPEDLGNDLFFVRTLHLRRNSDHYRMIPLKLHVRRSSRDDVPRMLLNGEPCVEECVRDLAEYEALEIEILA